MLRRASAVVSVLSEAARAARVATAATIVRNFMTLPTDLRS